jgi:hypothetical protein
MKLQAALILAAFLSVASVTGIYKNKIHFQF